MKQVIINIFVSINNFEKKRFFCQKFKIFVFIRLYFIESNYFLLKFITFSQEFNINSIFEKNVKISITQLNWQLI